jgi:hypothetical protein
LDNVPAEVVTAAGQKPGFLLRITGMTPNPQASRLLNDTFFHNLVHRYAPADVKLDFYVADAFMVRQGLVKNNTARMQEISKANQNLLLIKNGGVLPAGAAGGAGGGGNFGGGGANPFGAPGMPPMAAGGGAPGSPDDPTLYRDPVTGEDMREWTEFQVVVFVVLGQPAVPPVPAAGNPQ